MTTTARPEIVTEEHLGYLDDMRASGETNMFGAGAYLKRAFKLKEKEASEILRYWMHTFSDRHPKTERR